MPPPVEVVAPSLFNYLSLGEAGKFRSPQATTSQRVKQCRITQAYKGVSAGCGCQAFHLFGTNASAVVGSRAFSECRYLDTFHLLKRLCSLVRGVSLASCFVHQPLDC